MRTVSIFATLLLLAGIASTQPHAGDFMFVNGSGLTRITPAGVATTLFETNTFTDGITVAYDNQGVLFSEYGSTASTLASVIHEYRGGTVTALFSTTDVSIVEILVNQNGEVVFTGRDKSGTTGLFKWSGGTSYSTITTTASLGVSRAALDGGLETNVNTGNYMIASAFQGPGQVWDVDDAGVVTSLVSTATPPVAGRFSMAQDKGTGTVCQGGFSDYRFFDTTGVQSPATTPTGGTLTDYYYAIRIDRASTPSSLRRLHAIYLSDSPTTSAYSVVDDPFGGAPTYTSTGITAPTGFGSGGTGLVWETERNLGSMKTGPGAYSLNINFPGEGGNQYVIGLSFTGFSPGFSLPDERQVCINFDVLTVTSVNNLLKPFFDPGPGTLDPNGNATGTIALGADGLGFLIHAVAVTLSGATIVTVSSPVTLKV